MTTKLEISITKMKSLKASGKIMKQYCITIKCVNHIFDNYLIENFPSADDLANVPYGSSITPEELIGGEDRR